MAERKTAGKKASTKKASTKKASTRKSATRTTSKTRTRKAATKASPRKASPKRWSAEVTETSDAMDLKEGVFKGRDPHKIALSIKHSAEASDRKKGTPYQSAMSMLTFYINRAGHNLSPARMKVLEKAKDELRALFGKEG